LEKHTMAIHPTAIVDRRAELDSTVEVGPYAIIEGPVKIGARSRIRSHAIVTGWTELGEDCDIYPYAVIGGDPQDFHFKGDRSYCRLGNRVMVREGASIHRGSYPESATVIGDDTVFLSTAHAGHNCELGKGVQVQHGALLAGHVFAQDKAIFGAHAMVHQFVRIGSLAFLAAGARVGMDVPPFMICQGDTTLVAHNVVGMRRAGYSPEELFEIRQAYRTLYRSGLLFRDAVQRLAGMVKTDAGRLLVSFLQSESKRGFAAGGSHRTRKAVGGEARSDATSDE
jgi:UDP-N-acetylglucosamine acyltransferase